MLIEEKCLQENADGGMMKRADSLGLSDASSAASLCLALEWKPFPEDGIMSLKAGSSALVNFQK